MDTASTRTRRARSLDLAWLTKSSGLRSSLSDLDLRFRILAQAVEPATVRSLDAVHLGTALQSRPGLTSFVTYDKRPLDAAQMAGLPVDSPA